MKICIGGTVNDSIVDGPGLRFTLFVQGCPHQCSGCHNPQTWDVNGGSESDTDTLLSQILKNPLLQGVTFSGGEPFVWAEELSDLGAKLKQSGLSIMTYSGYTWEELTGPQAPKGAAQLLAVTDILVDGRFEFANRSLELLFRGSSNQRLIDVQKSFAAGKAVECTIAPGGEFML